MPVSSTVRTLVRYALSKPGARRAYPDWYPGSPEVQLMAGSWPQFFSVVESGSKVTARLPVRADRLAEIRKSHKSIKENSSYVERDGHIHMNVPLDGNLAADVIKGLIDEAHTLVYAKLDDSQKLGIELSAKKLGDGPLLDRLVQHYGLSKRRKKIDALAKWAVLLRTSKVNEAKIPLGTSKIGGRPDLPADAVWPTYSDGRPLSFLIQLDLAQIAPHGACVKGLPSEGLLSIFSVWGWMEEGDADAAIPGYSQSDIEDQPGWTVAFVTPTGSTLERLKTPKGLNAFKAAPVEPVPILSLPKHRRDPVLATCKWTEEEFDSFDSLQMDLLSLQLQREIPDYDYSLTHHLLGGYALFQQDYPVELEDGKRAMLLQIGADQENTNTMWGDGGELTIYADAKALARGKFQRLWSISQGG